jgi:quercetin dioxygenase-like cupin family protein
VTRREERDTIKVREGGMIYERLHGEFVGASFSAFLITLPAGFITELDQHQGEEFVEVRSGRVLFQVDTEEYDLGVGDTLHFRSDLHHQASNPHAEEAVLFWLGNGPRFQSRPGLIAEQTS